MTKSRFNKKTYSVAIKGGFIFTLLLMSSISLMAQQLAFPGADGFGKYTTGGRGGEVYIVTNLNDSGPGSLRAGVEMSGARTIVFAISGTIHLNSDLKITNNDISIFGQTAPGDGIAIQGAMTVIDADNVIIQHVRFRPGDISDGEPDALWGREQKNIMIDHVSMSWSVDETGSFYDNENFTLQWSILSESLYESQHGKGRHGYGGIWGGAGASFHHNLLAHHSSRNPRFNGSRYTTSTATELVDFRNNVIYNWGGNSAYGAEGGSYNLVGNYYKPGPATNSNTSRILQVYSDNGVVGKFYVAGNITEGSSDVTSDNWLGIHLHNSLPDNITKEDLKSETEFDVMDLLSEQSAEEAFDSVLVYAGAILPRRDVVDARIVEEAETGTATFGGQYGSGSGIIDSQEDVGGWPELLSANPPEDNDSDGIPDSWETENGLDPGNPDDSKEINETGYSNLELYVHSLQEQGDFDPVPGNLELLSPIQEEDVSLRPELKWTTASFASAYELEIRDVPDGDIVFQNTIPDTVYTLTEEEELVGNETYFWRVRAVNESGAGTWTSYVYFVTETPTSIAEHLNLPQDFALKQNYPNPFNPTTVIPYALPQVSDVELKIYDMTGRQVKSYLAKNQQPGNHTVEFDLNSLASGVYIYNLKAVSNSVDGRSFNQTRKMTLIK